jgi:hypothetical protein
MKPKEKIKLQWRDHTYEVGIAPPLPGNDETRTEFSSRINDEPKQIAFYLCESLMEPTAPESIHSYLEKLFKRKFSVGDATNKNKVEYFEIYESNDYGASRILISNNEARIQFERSL